MGRGTKPFYHHHDHYIICAPLSRSLDVYGDLYTFFLPAQPSGGSQKLWQVLCIRNPFGLDLKRQHEQHNSQHVEQQFGLEAQ